MKWQQQRKRRRRCNDAFIIFQPRQIKKQLTHTHTQSYHFIWPSWGSRDQQERILRQAGRQPTSTFLHMPDIFPVPAACASRIVLFAEGKSRSLNLNTDVLIALSPSARTPSAAHKVVTGCRGVGGAICNTNKSSGNDTRYQQPVQICLRHCQTSKQFVPHTQCKQANDWLADWRTDRLTNWQIAGEINCQKCHRNKIFQNVAKGELLQLLQSLKNRRSNCSKP